jgi:two-component system, NtrC family, sensor kinase
MSIIQRLFIIIKSFRFRLFAIFSLGTTLITITLSLNYIEREKAEFREHASERARLLAKLLAGNARLPLFADDRTSLQKLAEETARQLDVVEVKINAANGESVAAVQRGNANSSRINESLAITSDTEGDASSLALIGRSTPITLGNVLVSLDSTSLDKSIRQMTISIARYSFAFWLMVTIFSYLVLTRMTQSYGKLMEGLAAMRNGNFTVRIPVKDIDEPSQAARSLNNLADALQQQEADNELLHEKLLDAMRLQVQEEKRQVMAKLIQTNRMTSLGLLVSSMAHEINNPNGAIRLDGNFLGKMLHNMMPVLEAATREDAGFRLSGLRFDEARDEIFRAHKNIISHTNRIEAVIKDLRAYSLGVNNPFTLDIDINQVVTGALTIIRAHGQYTNAVISEDLSSGLPAIRGSRHQLEQVVVNLLLNALQSLPSKGGRVAVSTAVSRTANEVLVTVNDSGEGIPPEHIARLFEPFFSTRIESGGSGLGLYISRFIVSEHGGELTFASEVGAGTTVVMHMPYLC